MAFISAVLAASIASDVIHDGNCGVDGVVMKRILPYPCCAIWPSSSG